MKKLLKTRGFTQTAFAAAMGVSEPTVSNWISGVTRIPAERVAKAVAITGIPAEDWRPDLYASGSVAA